MRDFPKSTEIFAKGFGEFSESFGRFSEDCRGLFERSQRVSGGLHASCTKSAVAHAFRGELSPKKVARNLGLELVTQSGRVRLERKAGHSSGVLKSGGGG